ncbi:MAG TPA: hypothetical protein VNL16_16075 [Chloroflexota bacterium]|nr:hypothetical protein [Chloroflexota bacterium]
MLYSDPFVELELFRTRQRELERKLELARLLAAAPRDQRGLFARGLSFLGDGLIAIGRTLKERSSAQQTGGVPAPVQVAPGQSRQRHEAGA